jgi:hypothetical protein
MHDRNVLLFPELYNSVIEIHRAIFFSSLLDTQNRSSKYIDSMHFKCSRKQTIIRLKVVMLLISYYLCFDLTLLTMMNIILFNKHMIQFLCDILINDYVYDE